MAKTYAFDVSTPAGSDDPKQGDDRIRELKDAIHERENLDHYWEKSGDTADADDVGYHRKATLLVQASAPTAKADAGIIYSKDVSNKAELFYRDEDGDEVQITSGGSILGGTFVAGDLLLSSVGTAHTGWTEVTSTYANKYIRIGSTGLATGGAATHTHGAGSYAGPSHTHTVPASSTGWGGTDPTNGTLAVGKDVATESKADSATNDVATAAGGTGTITGTSAAGVNTPLYVDVRVFQKD